jgi:VanZ family protein
MAKHYNNSQCFKEKNYKAKFLVCSILKKIKLTETSLEKNNKNNTKKRKKNHVGNTLAIQSVL